MKIGYFDCIAGASGDMILGSLLDCGLDFDYLKAELEKLDLKDYTIKKYKDQKKGISGTKFQVSVKKGHHHRGLHDILDIIDKSDLNQKVKSHSKEIFTNLAKAESKIHAKSVEEIHFHEVGAVDAIIDITGAAIGFDYLNIEKIIASKIHIGTGTLQCTHGTLPVPAPATLELLSSIPVYSTNIEQELITPTGAAILTTLGTYFGGMPSMTIEKSGYGLGSRDLEIPNILRLTIGDKTSEFAHDVVQMIETNIDDMNPQFYEHIMDILFKHGAKDVFLTSVIMKKNRPGIMLNVLADPSKVDILTEIIFNQTTTLGVRISEIKKRNTLHREAITVDTSWGKVRVKVRILNESNKSVAPEYDDCKKIALKKNIPLQIIYDKVKQIAQKKISS